jgi:hypothetical protein
VVVKVYVSFCLRGWTCSFLSAVFLLFSSSPSLSLPLVFSCF